ncbi:MerR family transcriptional regulator [Burkholderiaceae bacterium DAT-1]|nr:MerR family transcriptional regulator [Burkholderiaceae bacterium DAT-1]
MTLRVGELAKQTGLTVRTLHHYDQVGLLSPSIRADNGYRLYSAHDVSRLYKILALKRLGLSLDDIRTTLEGSGDSLPALIQQQIAGLNSQIQNAISLRDRLVQLHQQLDRGDSPSLADWLKTLGMMTMYDKYFTTEEQAELHARRDQPEVARTEAAWPELINRVSGYMKADLPPAHPDVQTAARTWLHFVQSFTGANPSLMVKSANMMMNEKPVQAATGIEPDMMRYMAHSLATIRLELYSQFLSESDMQTMRQHFGTMGNEWLPVIQRARTLLSQGLAVDHPEVQAIARQWEALTERAAGTDPVTRQRLRAAWESDPALMARTGVDRALLDYMRQAGIDAVF